MSGTQQPLVRLRQSDADELKHKFILGSELPELAEELAERRQCPVEQALRYLERVRARDRWFAQRQQHVDTIGQIVLAKAQSDQIAALATAQSVVAERLIQMGVGELVTTEAVTRREVLQTIDLGFKMGYRSLGQPGTINTISQVASAPEGIGTADRQQQIAELKSSGEQGFGRALGEVLQILARHEEDDRRSAEAAGA